MWNGVCCSVRGVRNLCYNYILINQWLLVKLFKVSKNFEFFVGGYKSGGTGFSQVTPNIPPG